MNNSKMETGIPDIFSNSDTVTAKGLDTAPTEEQILQKYSKRYLEQTILS